jgi:hypothetical protein
MTEFAVYKEDILKSYINKIQRQDILTYSEREGRAIAQVVSRWLPIAAAQVRSRDWSSGI